MCCGFWVLCCVCCVLTPPPSLFQVKWRGLSHMFCSWESREAINDDDKINEFHKINDSPPPDPPLTQAELDQELRKDRPRSVLSARRTSHWNQLWELESHIHSQIRSLHFLKFNELPPQALTLECGPHAAGLAYGGYQVSLCYEQQIKTETNRD